MRKLGKKRTFYLIISFIAFLVVLHLIVTAFSIVSYGKADKKMSSDVAIVLGAATSNGDISPVYRERINHGIWLYENGYVDYLILTGGIGDGNTFPMLMSPNNMQSLNLYPRKSFLSKKNLQ